MSEEALTTIGFPLRRQVKISADGDTYRGFQLDTMTGIEMVTAAGLKFYKREV